jgi:hypothetical protein
MRTQGECTLKYRDFRRDAAISRQAISGTEPQAEMPMENEAERFGDRTASLRMMPSPALQRNSPWSRPQRLTPEIACGSAEQLMSEHEIF